MYKDVCGSLIYNTKNGNCWNIQRQGLTKESMGFYRSGDCQHCTRGQRLLGDTSGDETKDRGQAEPEHPVLASVRQGGADFSLLPQSRGGWRGKIVTFP